jgi:hypothetical protein
MSYPARQGEEVMFSRLVKIAIALGILASVRARRLRTPKHNAAFTSLAAIAIAAEDRAD